MTHCYSHRHQLLPHTALDSLVHVSPHSVGKPVSPPLYCPPLCVPTLGVQGPPSLLLHYGHLYSHVPPSSEALTHLPLHFTSCSHCLSFCSCSPHFTSPFTAFILPKFYPRKSAVSRTDFSGRLKMMTQKKQLIKNVIFNISWSAFVRVSPAMCSLDRDSPSIFPVFSFYQDLCAVTLVVSDSSS